MEITTREHGDNVQRFQWLDFAHKHAGITSLAPTLKIISCSKSLMPSQVDTRKSQIYISRHESFSFPLKHCMYVCMCVCVSVCVHVCVCVCCVSMCVHGEYGFSCRKGLLYK